MTQYQRYYQQVLAAIKELQAEVATLSLPYGPAATLGDVAGFQARAAEGAARRASDVMSEAEIDSILGVGRTPDPFPVSPYGGVRAGAMHWMPRE